MQIAIESYKNDGVSFTDWFIDNYEMLLEKEKENIINAYSIGFLVSKDLDMAEPSSYITEDYYNQAHNQNKLTITSNGKVGLSNPEETTNNKLIIKKTVNDENLKFY